MESFEQVSYDKLLVQTFVVTGNIPPAKKMSSDQIS
jgi:hypothetical protein